MRSYEDLDARNGMNRAPRSSRDLTARSFENQLMGTITSIKLKKFKYPYWTLYNIIKQKILFLSYKNFHRLQSNCN